MERTAFEIKFNETTEAYGRNGGFLCKGITLLPVEFAGRNEPYCKAVRIRPVTSRGSWSKGTYIEIPLSAIPDLIEGLLKVGGKDLMDFRTIVKIAAKAV